MTMHNPALARSNRRSRREIAMPLSLLLILSGCATGQIQRPPNTSVAQTRPLACSDFPPLKFNPGNVGATPDSIGAVMKAHPENPLGWARGELGDTTSTRAAISTYAAARRGLGCD